MTATDARAALVTGAGRGIGRAIALRLAADGAAVVVQDLDEDVAKAVVDEIVAAGGRAVSCAGSVADPQATDAMVEIAEREFGGLDLLVNNAGLTHDGTLHRMSDADWDSVVDVVLRGTFNACRSAARLMRVPRGVAPDHHRKVVNIASINGVYGVAGNANYSASKAGVIGLTKSLAREWGPQHINVNAIAPGYIEGTRLTRAREDGDTMGMPEEIIPVVVSKIPIGRAGTPEDVADLTRVPVLAAVGLPDRTDHRAARRARDHLHRLRGIPWPSTRSCRCREAAALVSDGDVVALQNMATQAAPMALVRELIRQQRRDLTLVALVGGIPVDWLAAAGCLSGFIGAAVSMEQFGLCQQYRKAVEAGTIRVEELSETALNSRLGAGRAQPAVPAHTWTDRHRSHRGRPGQPGGDRRPVRRAAARRVPRARTRCRAGARTPRRPGRQHRLRPVDPLAGPRHHAEGARRR